MLGFLTKFRADFEARMPGAAAKARAGADGDRRRPGGCGGVNIAGAEPGLGDQIVFCVLAAFVTFFALFTITRRNPVTAVMSLVGDVLRRWRRSTRCCPRTSWPCIQVLVYAGAIMVLFIFVVMILNREEVAPLALRPHARCWASWPASTCWSMFAGVVHRGRRRPQAVPGVVPETYGTVAVVGDMLFREFLYPFEAISLLLLVAIVGGVVVSRSHQKEVAAKRAADYRKQVHELASRRLPGRARRRPTAARRSAGTSLAMPTRHYLVLVVVLFLIGTAGVLLRRNALIVLMCIELQLNGGNLTLLAFSRAARRPQGARRSRSS